jgi:hypothetical protein
MTFSDIFCLFCAYVNADYIELRSGLTYLIYFP